MAEYFERHHAIETVVINCLPQCRDFLIKELEAIPSADVQPVTWIPVTEQLPEENGRYLTVMHRTVDQQYRNELGDDDTEVRITRFCKGEWKVPLHSPKWINEAITDTVTHWMSLPKLPKDNET